MSRQPLAGKSFLITRPKGQSAELARELERLGATTYCFPALEILPLEDDSELRSALANLRQFDWIVLTSVNGVGAVGALLGETGRKALQKIKAAVIGPATQAELETLRGRPAEICPSSYVSEEIAEALGDVRGQRFLLARANLARPALANLLRERGALVDEVTAYQIGIGSEGELPIEAPDYITITSAASASALVKRLGEAGQGSWLASCRLVAIGPITAEAILELGLPEPLVADVYTSRGILEAVLKEVREAAHV